jgi:hypothetical protein
MSQERDMGHPGIRWRGETVIDDVVVKLAAEYLELHVGGETPATLMGMIREIDYINRTIPRFEEVNEALKKCPSMRVRREGGKIEFSVAGDERKITFEEMERAYTDYREWLAEEIQKIQSQQ